MNGAIGGDLLLNCTDMSVLERQRAHLKYLNPGFDSTLAGLFSDSSMMKGGEIDGFLGTSGLDLPAIYGETTVESDPRLLISPGMTIGNGNFKKRKFDTEAKDRNDKKKKMMMNREEVAEEEEEKSKITEQNNGSTKSIKKMKNKAKKEENNCSNASSNVTKELQKTDYIHVRARRGQATDSHSIAERVQEAEPKLIQTGGTTPIRPDEDICSLFEAYQLNHDDSSHETTWRLFTAQPQNTTKKNHPKSYYHEEVMGVTSQQFSDASDKDLRSHNESFRPDQEGKGNKSNCSRTPTNHKHAAKWNQPIISSHEGDIVFLQTSYNILGCTNMHRIKYSSTNDYFLIRPIHHNLVQRPYALSLTLLFLSLDF